MLGVRAARARTRAVSDQRGVTLVELMVAMILLTVALLVLAAAIPLGLYSVVAGGYQTTATLLAQQSIESAKSTPYGSLSTLNTSGGSGTCGAGTGTFVAVSGYDGFTRCVDVQTAVPTAQTTSLTAVVRFSGVGGVGAGTIYDTTLGTVIAQP